MLGVHCPRWAVHLNHLPGPSSSVSWLCRENTVSGMLCVSSGELISGCDPSGRCQPSRIPARLGLATESLLSGGGCWSLGPTLPFVFWLWLSPACLSASGGWMGQSAAGQLAFGIRSIFCYVSGPGCTSGQSFLKESFFFPLLLAIPQFGLLSHESSLRVSSGHSGPVLTLNAACTSLSCPRSLVVDRSVWASSLLGVVVRRIFCGVFFSSPPSYVAL